MKLNKESNDDSQFFYLGRWVDRKHFRAFVYQKNKRKLVESVQAFEEAIATGLWFDSIENIKEEVNHKVEEKEKVSESKRKLKVASSRDG